MNSTINTICTYSIYVLREVTVTLSYLSGRNGIHDVYHSAINIVLLIEGIDSKAYHIIILILLVIVIVIVMDYFLIGEIGLISFTILIIIVSLIYL